MLPACVMGYVRASFLKKLISRVLSNCGELRKDCCGPALRISVGAFLLTAALFPATSLHAQNVTTWHYDTSRSGVQQNETTLSPSNVNSTLFGKLFSFSVAGDTYAQPLYVHDYQMNDGNLHNVLIVATEEDMVYAFDADGNNPSQGYLWAKSLAGAGETYVGEPDVGVKDISPNLGITGTPVIDPGNGVIYVVARSKTTGSSPKFYQRLHALNLANGAEILNGPTQISASFPGTGYGGTTVSFDPLMNNQRASLLLAATPNGPTANSVFIAFASNGDTDPYHGWIISYDAANISTQTGAWVDTPNAEKGGIWMSGGGPSSDNQGNIFFGIGNGNFDAGSGGSDYGDSEIHLALNNSGFTVADSFTPYNQSSLASGDHDMGMAAPLLLPVQTSGDYSNLLVTADKAGTIYLINANQMGGYLTSQDSSVQDFQVPNNNSSGKPYSIHSGFAFFNNTLFVGPDNSPLLAYNFDPVNLLGTTPSSKSATAYGTCGTCYVSGPTPSVSANNGNNGIVWALDNSLYNNDPAILHAYDATNLAHELYNSTQASGGRDTGGVATKFTTPTIANGKVYVGGRNTVTAYGLLAPPTVATPTFSLQSGSYTGAQYVSISDKTSNASIYYTTDGSMPSSSTSAAYTGQIQVASSETISAIATLNGYNQSAEAQATYTITAASPQTTATPTFSLKSGSYVGAQQVGLSDTTANAVIYYTDDGSMPNPNTSTAYIGPFQVASSQTISAIAAAPGYNQSAEAQAAYTITSAPPSQVTVSLSSAFNLMGIITDGTKYTTASLNGSGCDFSASQLGNPLAFSSLSYSFGSPNTKNVVKSAKQVIKLTPGQYSSINVLALAVGTNQKSQVFTVTYSDKSTSKFTQSISDWITPEHYSGESIAKSASYCDAKAGTETKGTHDLYEYTFKLNNAKTAETLTLPSSSGVIVFAITLAQ